MCDDGAGLTGGGDGVGFAVVEDEKGDCADDGAGYACQRGRCKAEAVAYHGAPKGCCRGV